MKYQHIMMATENNLVNKNNNTSDQHFGK